MSKTPVAAAVAVDAQPLGHTLNPDSEARWIAWKARGIAHDTVVRQRSRLIAIVVTALALGALVGYRVLFS